MLGFVYAQSGRKDDAITILNELEGPTSSEQVGSPFEIALLYTGLGENNRAVEWLEKAKAAHDPFLPYVKEDPNFDSLRNESRFTELLRSSGFAN